MKADLIKECEAELKEIPGVDYNFSQAIQDIVEEAMSGVKGENSIKLFGDDLEHLDATANHIKNAIADVPGVTDLGIFVELGQPNLLIGADREQAARYGILAGGAFRPFQDDLHASALRSEFDRVGEQVQDDLLQTSRVASHLGKSQIQWGMAQLVQRWACGVLEIAKRE